MSQTDLSALDGPKFQDNASHETTDFGKPNDGPFKVETAIEPLRAWYLNVKLIFDVVVGSVLLLIVVPIILIAAIVVKLTSRGPAFYSQIRLGRDSRPFRIYKLRSMVDHAEVVSGPVWARPDDPRVTPVGDFLRMTHVDELPQLINVVMGQMSLIGPRPERPEIGEQLMWKLPNYVDRLVIRPGITGIAQINLPPDYDLNGARKKLIHDLYYVHHVSFWLDFRILLFTSLILVKTVCSSLWHYVSMLFALPSGDLVNARLEELVGSESLLLLKKHDGPPNHAA